MKKALIGIDPGRHGFITVFVNNDYHFFPPPEKKVESGKFNKNGTPKYEDKFDENGFKDIYEKIKILCEGCEIHCAIEEVGGRGGNSAQSSFSFGFVAGLQRMVIIMLGAKILLVKPLKWQTVVYKGFEKTMIKSSTGKTMVHDTKDTSRRVASEIAPHIDFRKNTLGRGKKLDDNKTDSFLILLYLKSHIVKNGL